MVDGSNLLGGTLLRVDFRAAVGLGEGGSLVPDFCGPTPSFACGGSCCHGTSCCSMSDGGSERPELLVGGGGWDIAINNLGCLCYEVFTFGAMQI